MIDVSECDTTDLIKRIHGRLEKDACIFYETTQAVLNALNNDQRVVLTGQFSDALLDNLAPFLYARFRDNQPLGQLIMITE